jgi:D-tyrosyl-tRNA(Tyr) deacylase
VVVRAVIQRARDASVTVDGTVVGRFEGHGLVVLVGVTHADTPTVARRLAAKVHDLRIFEPENAHSPERSAAELDAPLLVISQFTLYGDTRKGRRPTWTAAAPGDVAEPLVNEVVDELRRRGASVATGRFGADMQVHLTNDGPMTVLLDLDAPSASST